MTAGEDLRAHRDTEQVVAAAQAAAGAANNILNLVGDPMLDDGELDTMANDLAEALGAVLSWKRHLTNEDCQLLGSLQRWLP